MSGWGLPRHKHAHVLAVSNICVHCELEVASVVLARAAMASGKQEPVLKEEEGPEETPPFGVVEVKGGVPSGKAPFVFMNSVPKQKASGKTPPFNGPPPPRPPKVPAPPQPPPRPAATTAAAGSSSASAGSAAPPGPPPSSPPASPSVPDAVLHAMLVSAHTAFIAGEPPAAPPAVPADAPEDTEDKTILTVWAEDGTPMQGALLHNVVDRIRERGNILSYFVTSNGWLWCKVGQGGSARSFRTLLRLPSRHVCLTSVSCN